jgi:hypothetical protein
MIKFKNNSTIPSFPPLGELKGAINVSNLANGTYIISFGSDGISNYSKKFTIKH